MELASWELYSRMRSLTFQRKWRDMIMITLNFLDAKKISDNLTTLRVR